MPCLRCSQDPRARSRWSPACGCAMAVRQAIRRVDPSARTFVYGHVGDGNLHVNVLGPDPDDEGVDDAVLELAIATGGAVSAEHGIGVAKVRWLVADRGEPDVT